MDLNFLANEFKKGNKDAFDKLYEKSLPIVKAAIFSYLKDKEDAKDLIQVIYLKVSNNISSFESNSFENWIYTIAKNTTLDFLKKKKEERLEEVDFISDEIKNPNLHFAISKLDNLHKDIFLAKVLINTSTKNLAKIFNLSPYEVNKIYKEAKEILKKELKDLWDITNLKKN